MEKISSSSPAKRILLVGMKLSSECRERLTWIVARLTIPGDHVIAVHVLQSSSSTALSSELDPATRKELDETFQGVLGVYQGLCTLKQIKLDIKVVVGASVKECLVDAAKLEDATKLILGTSRFVPTGLSTSLAKYCLKRLPSSCSVTIIDRGKVIFERPGYRSSSSSSNNTGKEVSSCAQTCTPSVLQRGIMKRLSCSSSRHQASEFDTSGTDNDSPGGSNDNNPGSSNSGRSSVVLEANLSDSDRSYPASPVSVLHPNTDEFKPPESKESQDHLQGSSMTCEDGKALQGWPLRAFPLDKVVSSPSREPEERELSVVNWALQLPNRSQRRREALECSSARDSVSSSSSEFGCEQKLLSKCRSAPPPRERSLLLECLRQEVEAPLEQEEASKLNDEKPAETASSLSLSQRLQLLYTKNTSAAVKFDAEELLKATSNLSSKNLVGRGGCSQVFKGTLANGQAIAVKSLNEVTADSEGELVTEVEILSSLRHRNVISLLGYSANSKKRMLVYNFAANGNLEQCLHGENSKTSFLDWPSRRKIAIGAAEGLEYLHDGCPRPVIHRDVKSSNILLSSTNEALISDFGLAKWAPTTTPHITCTDVVGTFGYLAPEYFMFGKLNEKTDVYSFGVVLLELITGKHPINASNQKGQENLIKWGRPLLESGNLEKLVDPRLQDDYDVQHMKLMVLAAALCLRQSPQHRPRMRRISRLLSGDEENSLLWANRELKLCKGEEQHCIDEDYARPSTSDCEVRTHLALAMLGVEDDVASECDQSSSSMDFVSSRKSLEDYFGGRCSQ
ncbi:U-box domain-containing protein 51 [Selaginella moellendorffii]|uniref:U-box domain-containing protein 51 n=1 Tax=Selaginella moellendorffii TaxID=88036 RepID=UPI000D1C69D4|nr:U-box domain-containing protein 51 [Selaginella moellendorffii]|eukprot:XP_002965549.2 U-box domain-containing protein 51 [Selaginella moellendorffii]